MTIFICGPMDVKITQGLILVPLPERMMWRITINPRHVDGTKSKADVGMDVGTLIKRQKPMDVHTHTHMYKHISIR